jgi:hypothetical protein
MKHWSDAMEANRQEGRTIWDPRWLPLTNDGKDGFHAVTCGSGDGEIIAFYFVDLPDGWWLEFAGLTAMIEAFIRRWAAGVYWESGGGGVDCDDRAEAALRRAEDTEQPDINTLIRDLSAGSDSTMDEALNLLRTRLYPQAVPGLIAMLEDPANSRHHLAIELLGAIGDRAALPSLRHAAEHDPQPGLRDYARKVLEGIEKLDATTSPKDR